MNIAGSICLVTGAGRGIGRRIAADLAQAGALVYACDISATALAELQADAEGLPLTLAVADVADEVSVTDLFTRVVQEHGRLDVLVNNAGITRDGLLVKVKDGEVKKMPLADFQSVIDVNLTGVFLCGREAAALMAQGSGGVIVNLSSVSRAGNFGQTNYAASKAGVDAMTVTWAKELARYHIRVAAVAPGYIGTEMVRAIKPETLEKIVAQVPLKRLGEMSEISHAVQFIIENDFVNGRVLEIDGGLRL
jgi:3-oxoacyl-[acyl-carrier protein] reductase